MGRPGKFEGNSDQDLAERLHAVTLDGGCNEELGDVETFGWFGLILDFEGRSFVVSEDSQGFFDIDSEHEDQASAQRAWGRISMAFDETQEETQ